MSAGAVAIAPDPGVAIAPAPEKKPAPKVAERVRWYTRYWRRHRFFLVFLFLFTLVSSAVAISYPLVFRAAIDRAAGALGPSVEGALAVLALIALGRFVAGYYPFTRAWMNANLDRDIREDHFDAVLRKDHRFQGALRTGDVVTRLTDDLWEYPKVAWFGCSGIFRAVDSSSKLVFCMTAMVLLDWRLALLSSIPLPFMLAAFYVVRRRLAEGYEKQQEAISKTNDLLEATFTGIRIVKAFGAEPGQERRLRDILKGRVGVELSLAVLMLLVQSLDTIASRLGQVIVLAVGGYRVATGELSLGTLYAFYVYLDMLAQPMMDLPMLLVSGRQAFVSVDRLDEIKRFPAPDARPEADDAGEAARETVDRLETVELRDVSFAYDRAPTGAGRLESVSFRVKRGERVAVVGPVGGGKSTLVKVLAGLLPAPPGTFRVNGRPLEAVSFASFRRRLGYVPQESLLFSETVADNVAFGREGADVEGALAAAQMQDDLPSFKDGTATVLGPKGALISGGQRQRIAIARALALRPDLLLLDDCTASLDARSEERFWTALERFTPEAACVVVTHRLATCLKADRIVVVERGRVADEGSHEDLVARSPVYRSFLDEEARRAHLAAAGELVPA